MKNDKITVEEKKQLQILLKTKIVYLNEITKINREIKNCIEKSDILITDLELSKKTQDILSSNGLCMLAQLISYYERKQNFLSLYNMTIDVNSEIVKLLKRYI